MAPALLHKGVLSAVDRSLRLEMPVKANGPKCQAKPERRANPRARLKDLTCFRVGPDNGAIVLDASVGGMLFCAVAPLAETGIIRLNFSLWDDRQIEATARIAWMDETGKSGGLQFIDVPAEAREHILNCCPDPSFRLHGGGKIKPLETASGNYHFSAFLQATQSARFLPELREALMAPLRWLNLRPQE